MEFNFDFFSPEQSLISPLGEEKGIKIFIKRDDMIHPYISGNKWRKLKYLLIKARDQNKNHLVTFGGNWSNHILATAAAAAQFKFKSTAYIRGEKVDNSILSLCKLFGMNIHFVTRDEYKNKEELFQKYHDNDPSSFFINEGGYSIEAVKGCEEIISELTERYDHIFAACGTGATLAGLAKGASKFQPNAHIHGIPVLKGGDFIETAVHNLCPEVKINLHTDYHFGGYAKTKPELIEFIKNFCKDTGILIEPVYTGKLFFAVMDLISKNHFKKGEHILILHSGGLTGFLGQQAKF
ncbi:1-aminocyclopropane-1-carboxylate deaminase/D-cysteine desulfhydrase [Albibacterium bauzanense]|uniref:1-aminocyclopropane-1-carboxylate deaminase n=1 Tax=Albibacterium bauzanense TaxID=653929 RepID=A0A4R1M2A9_9SPHI|nr:pyridoxal-phosphate dependent enzyme [Albibacterium bauzanense]TCK85342.1 1-aminocyclopropane-1-carboxylate deaminase [Albibacterium bauzanense]